MRVIERPLHVREKTKMTKRLIVICIAVFLSCIVSIGQSAASSEVARAAERGDRAAVRDLIGKKADVNATQPDGASRATRHLLGEAARRRKPRPPAPTGTCSATRAQGVLVSVGALRPSGSGQ